MGIYPDESRSKETVNPDGTATWTETWSVPGLTRTRTATASAWIEDRTDCYCCSCGDYIGSDHYCRNHGGHYGERPCEKHNMPGTADEDGVMPKSVQERRKEMAD